jgi:two-component system, NtrC family, response regulator AlgB
MANLLVVDDEPNIRAALGQFFDSQKHDIAVAASGLAALELMNRAGTFDLVLTDVQMAEMNGLELLKEIKSRSPNTIVILMTAYGTIQNAVAAMQAGAYDYVTKPFSLDQIKHAVDRALEVKNLRSENRALHHSINGLPLLTTRSPQFRSLIETAYAAASSDATILLTGESGTGKNVLARQIHEWSSRHDKPFVVVNCTTLSDQLLESELFGHTKGSFTGAIKDKPGLLEAADGGSVFLDEIAELQPSLQSKFLRFLQDEGFERAGGEQTIQVNARIIAATNRNLREEISATRFRGDLYYRLNVINIRLPPLRERLEDVLPLAEVCLAEAAARNRRCGLRLSDEAREALLAYSWPGNIRELRNLIERAVVLSRGGLLRKEDLPDILFHPGVPPNGSVREYSTLEQVEQEYIRRVIALAPTLEDAAATLGICVATLWRKRKRLDIA